jgi:membrane fusion protein (multidrug efflux system)
MTEAINKKFNRKRVIIVSFLIALVSAAAWLSYSWYTRTYISTDDAYIAGRIHMVAPKIGGTVAAVYVSDNQYVKAEELLLEIKPEDYEVRVKQASTILNAEKSNMKKAELDFKRAEKLLKTQAVSQAYYDQVKTSYDTLSSLVKQKEAMLQEAKLNMQYAKIYSPVAGYVTKKSVEVGEQLRPGQPVMAVVPLHDVWVIANYKETQLTRVKAGQKVRIKVDTYPGKVYEGRVDSIMAGTGSVLSMFPPENATGSFVKVVQRIPVKIILTNGNDDPKHLLRAGMSVVPTIIIK